MGTIIHSLGRNYQNQKSTFFLRTQNNQDLRDNIMGSFGVNMRLAVVLMLISSLEISLAFVQTRAVISIGSPMTKTGLRCSALNDLKSDIIRACNNPTTASQIGSIVQDFEDKAEQMGEGQSSSVTGLIAGKWVCY